MDCPEALILSIDDFTISNNIISGTDTKTKEEVFIMPSKKEIPNLEVQKTVEFHKSPLCEIHYALLSKKLNEYITQEMYYENGKL